MTLDLSNTFITFYLQGNKPEGSLTVALKSKYNNKYLIDGDTQYLVVTPIEWYTNWWKAQFTFATADYRAKDIAGYYNFELYDSTETLLLTKLVKVVNSWKGSQNTYHVGDNDNTEQYIMYK